MWGGEGSGGREGSNLTLFPSGLWWKAKIKLPAAAISAIWLSTNLIFFHRHTFPNQPRFPRTCTPSEFSFLHLSCFLPVCSAALTGRCKAINSLHSVSESTCERREGRHIRTSTFFRSISQKKSTPTGQGSCVRGAREQARGGMSGGG